MAFKLIISFALLAIVSAQEHQYHYQPQYSHGYGGHVKTVEHDVPAEYEFSYAVHDEHTGDIKSQQESRKGDAVHGQYELIDADGYKRIVKYTADEHTGFNAEVHREPTDIKIPVHHKVATASAAPIAHYQHSAPIAHYQHSAPVTHYSTHAPVAPVKYYQSAPVAPATQYKSAKVEYSNEPAHVTFNGPHSNYHY